MSEFDNLKNAWKTISEAGTTQKYSANDIKKIVKKKSNNELFKIKRKIIFEASITIAFSIFFVLFIRFINPVDTGYALFFIGVILAISLYPYIKVLQLKNSNHPDLKSYLQEFLKGFDRLVKQCIRMATVLIPFAAIGGFFLGYHSAASQAEWIGFFKFLNLFLLSVFVALVSFGGYWVQNRYFNWIYGKNIQRLRNCLIDLEEAEEQE
jgi:hypothetical protein